MNGLRQVWFLMVKDIKIFFTDRMALFFFLLFPLLFISLFNYLLSGVRQQEIRLELHLVTREAGSCFSRDIIDTLETKDESKLKAGEPKIIWDKSYTEALQALKEKRLSGFVVFPEDFTRSIQLGYGATISVFVDPEATATRAALNGYANAISYAFGLQDAAVSAVNGLMVEQALTSASGAANPGTAGLPPAILQGIKIKTSSIKFEIDKVGEIEAPNPSAYVVPGYLVMFVFLAATTGAVAVIRERRNHTLERLIATSVSKEAILGGTYAGMAARGLVQVIIFWTVGIFVFNVDMGDSPAGVVSLSFLTVIMSSACALLFSTLVKTERAAGSASTLISLVLSPLGGCWWPLFITPRWMQQLALFTPHGWATTGFNKIMVFGGDFYSAMPEMLALTGFTVLFLTIALIRFRTSSELS
jgi:ABC-2 type transport system permease protein